MNGFISSAAFAGRLFASAKRWLRPSFLIVEIVDTPGQQAEGVLSHFLWFDSTMDLKLYDTLTREKRVFRPLDPSNVRMYVCGPTVYDFAHIGNARPVIVFDVLFRLLRHIYGDDHVTYVRNITDVDDKINARAAEEYLELPLNEGSARSRKKPTSNFTATSLHSAACHRRSSRAPPSTSPRCSRSSTAWSNPATPMSPRTTCCSTSPRCRITASCRNARSTK